MSFYSIQNILSVPSFLRDFLKKSLTEQQRRVMLIAMTVFSVIASVALIYRYCFQTKKGQRIDHTKQEMEMPTIRKIHFVACHAGPAAHFAAFSKALDPKKYQVSILATGPALAKFKEQGVEATEFNPQGLNLDNEEVRSQLAKEVAKTCSVADVVITDLGHAFAVHLHEVFQAQPASASKSVPVHLSYYDNPEPLVPGGYSEVANRVMKQSNGVLFANAKLAQEPIYREAQTRIELGDIPCVGIGYYPIEQAERIREARLTQRQELRAQFLKDHGLVEEGQKICVYFGGNNSEYFDKALPNFINFIQRLVLEKNLSNLIILVHQHPGAKAKGKEEALIKEKNFEYRDESPRFIMSDFKNADPAQILADIALYYQTSMGPQFALAGIPVIQVGHERYSDILVRNQLCPSVTTSKDLSTAFDSERPPMNEEANQRIRQGLGIEKNWIGNLELALEKMLETRS